MSGASSPQSHGHGGGNDRSRLPVAGAVIAGKYQIVRVLGEGGMGIVYEATHLRLRQRVAVKMLLPSMLDHTIIVSRFEREARSAGQLRNRHVARVMDVDQMPDGLPYMVMEYLEGHDLQMELERRGQLPHDEVVDYVLQACAGMMEAHGLGIVHRDLKPSNLFLANDGEMRIVKVLDFGISKVQNEGDAKLTAAESVMGTAMYMSPEQVRSSGTVDARSDVWSLGVILFELLTGRPPWIGTPTQVAAAIVSEDPPDMRGLCTAPPELFSIVQRSLQRNADARFGSVKELAVALAPFAPVGGAGRIIADNISGASGGFPRVSIRPASDPHARVGEHSAPTIVQAAAVSESRMGTPRDGGTAPGWAQPSAAKSRGRTMIVAIAVAFLVALVVLGGGMALFIRQRDAGAKRAAASAHPSAATSLPAASTTAMEPAPPQVDPPPPATASSAVATTSATSPRPRPGAGGGAGKPPSKPPTAAPPTTSKPAAPPTPAPNPTIL